MIENKLSELSIHDKLSKYYNLPYNTKDDLYLILLLYANTKCLNSEELKIYNQLVKKLTFDCKSTKNIVFIDSKNKTNWEENNPDCNSRKQWERIALRICNKYSIEIELIPLDTVCDIAYEISKKTLPCEIITAISLQQKLCNLNISVNRSKEECNIDYKLLIEKHPNCELTKKQYVSLVDEGFSYEIVSLIYDNSFKIEVDSKGKITLISPIRKYKLPEDLKINDVIFTSDKKIIHKLLSDYKLSETLKENIINELKQI